MIKCSGNLTVKWIGNVIFKLDVAGNGCKKESLVEGRYSTTRRFHKSYYDEPKRSDFRKKENLRNQIHENWSISACFIIIRALMMIKFIYSLFSSKVHWKFND